MKKLVILAALIAATVLANATNSFSLGMDTLRIHPSRLDGYVHQTMNMTVDGFCDSWHVNATYPEGFIPKPIGGVFPREGLNVQYTSSVGKAIYNAELSISLGYSTIGSSIDVDGYWDYNLDGIFESYGTVKWEPGSYAMFDYNFYVMPSFRRGWMYFEGFLDSSPDRRGAILANVITYSRVWVYVGYMKGDVDGNDKVNIADVTELINGLLSGELDEFQQEAGDMNNDGQNRIADVTAIINMLLTK